MKVLKEVLDRDKKEKILCCVITPTVHKTLSSMLANSWPRSFLYIRPIKAPTRGGFILWWLPPPRRWLNFSLANTDKSGSAIPRLVSSPPFSQRPDFTPPPSLTCYITIYEMWDDSVQCQNLKRVHCSNTIFCFNFLSFLPRTRFLSQE